MFWSFWKKKKCSDLTYLEVVRTSNRIHQPFRTSKWKKIKYDFQIENIAIQLIEATQTHFHTKQQQNELNQRVIVSLALAFQRQVQKRNSFTFVTSFLCRASSKKIACNLVTKRYDEENLQGLSVCLDLRGSPKTDK